jgi:hypothetical protein
MATLLSAFVAPPCVVGKQKKSSLLAFQLQQQQHSSLNVAVGTTTTTYSTRKLGIVRCLSSCNAKYESNNVCGEFKNEKDSRVVPQRGWENRCYWVEGRMAALLLALVQAVAAPIPLDGTILGEWSLEPAEAVLYSPDTKVPRSAEVALRRAIPAVNPSMKKMQVRVALFSVSPFPSSLNFLVAKQFSNSGIQRYLYLQKSHVAVITHP